MKNVKANILNIFNQEITLTGYVSNEDLNSNCPTVKFYEDEQDQDFFLISKKELVF